MLDEVTPLVLTYNEAPNIERTLARLDWARRVVVVDSMSSDGTVGVCSRFPQVEVTQRAFDDHARQWNFGVDLCTTPWVLALDADYVLGDGFVEELAGCHPPGDIDAFAASFTYCVYGRPLRSSLYPPRFLLFRRERCRYKLDGHTQRLTVPGRSGAFRSRIQHDDRKPLARWLRDQDRYANLEAHKLLATPKASLRALDRLRLLVVPAPVLVLLHVLFFKRVLLDGWPGWFYAFQRTLAELILALRLLEQRLGSKGSDPL